MLHLTLVAEVNTPSHNNLLESLTKNVNVTLNLPPHGARSLQDVKKGIASDNEKDWDITKTIILFTLR